MDGRAKTLDTEGPWWQALKTAFWMSLLPPLFAGMVDLEWVVAAPVAWVLVVASLRVGTEARARAIGIGTSIWAVVVLPFGTDRYVGTGFDTLEPTSDLAKGALLAVFAVALLPSLWQRIGATMAAAVVACLLGACALVFGLFAFASWPSALETVSGASPVATLHTSIGKWKREVPVGDHTLFVSADRERINWRTDVSGRRNGGVGAEPLQRLSFHVSKGLFMVVGQLERDTLLGPSAPELLEIRPWPELSDRVSLSRRDLGPWAPSAIALAVLALLVAFSAGCLGWAVRAARHGGVLELAVEAILHENGAVELKDGEWARVEPHEHRPGPVGVFLDPLPSSYREDARPEALIVCAGDLGEARVSMEARRLRALTMTIVAGLAATWLALASVFG